MKPSSLPPNFDLIARPYRWLEYLTFGPFLWRCRIHFLPQLSQRRHALILGDGDGRFTARLLRTNPQLRVTTIDGSRAMMKYLLQNAFTSSSHLTAKVADLRHWQPPPNASYDLIVTHFFLDCLTTSEIQALTLRLAPAIAPNALWLVSEFAIPQTNFGRFVASPLVALLYRAFHLITGLNTQSLPDHRAALTAAGFVCQSAQSQLRGLLISELWQQQEPTPPTTSNSP